MVDLYRKGRQAKSMSVSARTTRIFGVEKTVLSDIFIFRMRAILELREDNGNYTLQNYQKLSYHFVLFSKRIKSVFGCFAARVSYKPLIVG
jgi:hypothetical protein